MPCAQLLTHAGAVTRRVPRSRRLARGRRPGSLRPETDAALGRATFRGC